MNKKNIILNILGILFYLICMLYILMYGEYIYYKIFILIVLEIYTLIVLLYNRRNVLGMLSLINIFIPVNIVFFIINIVIKPKVREISKEKLNKRNKLLLRLSPLIVAINLVLFIFGIIQRAVSYEILQLGAIRLYGKYLISILEGDVSQEILFYVTRPVAIIIIICILLYYLYMMLIIKYFINRKQPLRAFKILILNFFTFNIYSLIYLKYDMTLLNKDSTDENSFESIRDHNYIHKSFFLRRLLVNFFALFVILMLISLNRHVSYNGYIKSSKIDSNTIQLSPLGYIKNINYKILEETGEGLYTLEYKEPAFSSYLTISDSCMIADLDDEKVFYNLPINEYTYVNLQIGNILDYQNIKLTKQEEYIDYKDGKAGLYKFDLDLINKKINEDEYFNISLYNKKTKDCMEIYFVDDDEYKITINNSENSKYRRLIYNKAELKEYLKDLDKEDIYITI